MHLGSSLQKVADVHVAIGNSRDPEGTVALRINGISEPGVKIMDLSRLADKVILTLIDVQSDEGEGAVVELTVHASVRALHKAQVRLPEERVAVDVLSGT